MIRFNEFFQLTGYKNVKVKFNMNAGDVNIPAWDNLLNDENSWIEMNAWKSRHSINNNLNRADYLLTFAQYYPYGPSYYVFGGLYKVEKIVPEVFDTVGYKLTLMNEYKEYRKRLIIKLEKPIGRDLYCRKFENVQEQLNPEIYELSSSTLLNSFPGYNNVSLSWKELNMLVINGSREWVNALSYVKGVYCITDVSNGKLYIGSASGNNEGLWQRWSSYANDKNPSGGNVELKKLKPEYIKKNFKYSIIEIFDTKTKQETILERESYWKNVFQTRKYGMNSN